MDCCPSSSALCMVFWLLSPPLFSLSSLLFLSLFRCWETETPLEFWVSLVFPHGIDQPHLLPHHHASFQGPALHPHAPSPSCFALVLDHGQVSALFPGVWSPPLLAFWRFRSSPLFLPEVLVDLGGAFFFSPAVFSLFCCFLVLCVCRASHHTSS